MKKILIVDDEENVTWAISESLKPEKHWLEVCCAKDGNEAMNLLSKDNFDLVITDVKMPGLDGINLLITIRKTYPKTKTVVMTAYGSEETKQKAISNGSIHYLEKPFNVFIIKELISNTLRNHA